MLFRHWNLKNIFGTETEPYDNFLKLASVFIFTPRYQVPTKGHLKDIQDQNMHDTYSKPRTNDNFHKTQSHDTYIQLWERDLCNIFQTHNFWRRQWIQKTWWGSAIWLGTQAWPIVPPRFPSLVNLIAGHSHTIWCAVSSSIPHFLQSGSGNFPNVWRCFRRRRLKI